MTISVKAQKKTARRLSDEIIRFNPGNLYSHIKLKEIGGLLRKEGEETEAYVKDNVYNRILISNLTGFSSIIAGIVSVVHTTLQDVVASHYNAEGWTLTAAGAALIYLGKKTVDRAFRMGDNWDIVNRETRRQDREESEE